MELSFDTKSYKTSINKYATIYSNDPSQPQVKIHLSSKVDAVPDTTLPYALSPQRFNFTEKNKKQEIYIENKSDNQLQLNFIDDLFDGLKMDIKKDKIDPWKTSKIKFEWKGEFQKENMARSLTFSMSGQDTTFFSIPIVIQGTNPTPEPAKKEPVKKDPVKKDSEKPSLDAKKK